MYSLTKPARLLGGLTLLALCGCQTYSPYGYGSGYGYPPPGTYAVPRNGYAPGGTVVPNNGVPYGGGGTVTPGKSTSNDFGAPSGASTVPNTKSPTFEAKRGNSGLLPNEKPVPDPKVNDSGFQNDPKGPAKTGGTSGAANNGPASGAFTPTSGTTRDASDGFPAGKSPFGSGAAADPSAGASAKIKLTGSDKGDDTQEPARFQPPKDAAPITPAGTPVKSGSSTIIDPSSASKPMSSAIGTPNPYDFDKKGYSWLRGIVNYDDRTKSWQIIYSLTGSDKYGGSLTLGDDAKLKRLRNDDVVYVEGRVDESRKTDRGKPVYKVENLFGPLVPKAQVRATSTTRNTVATSSR